jgi:hypothetical protein
VKKNETLRIEMKRMLRRRLSICEVLYEMQSIITERVEEEKNESTS